MTLATLASTLQASPKSWDELTAPQQQDARDSMRPNAQGFNASHRTFFGGWWLLATSGQVTAINALLPARTRVAAISHLGLLYLNIDLLTDSPDPGQTYYAARTVIQTLKCTNVTPAPP